MQNKLESAMSIFQPTKPTDQNQTDTPHILSWTIILFLLLVYKKTRPNKDTRREEADKFWRFVWIAYFFSEEEQDRAVNDAGSCVYANRITVNHAER